MNSDPMHTVVAVIQPFMLELVVDALRLFPSFPGMSVSELRGFGRRCAHAPHRGERTEVEPFEEHLRVEIYCRNAESLVEERQVRLTPYRTTGSIFPSER